MKTQLWHLWHAYDWSAVAWYWRPLGLVLFAVDVFCCFLGFHQESDTAPGHCLWCGALMGKEER